MDLRRLLALMVIVLCTCHISFSQKSLNGVAKIEAFDEDGELLETGSGIIAGDRGNQIFLVTAFHVVDDGDEFKVTFHERQWEQFTGTVYEKYNSDLDYAVLVVDVPKGVIKGHDFRQPDFDKLNTGSEVRVVGHPGGNDWTYNTSNVITYPQITTFEIGFSNIGIEPGFSGGALLNKKKDQLIGLVVNVETKNAIAVRITQVLKDLNVWKIPYNHILPYKPPRRKITYVFAALAAGATGAGFYFDSEANKKYDIYAENLDPNALGVYDTESRDDVLASANSNKNNKVIAWGAAGGMALLSVIFSKRKYKQDPSGISLILEGDSSGSHLGIAYKF